MGMFKDLSTLSKQSKEIRKNHDVGADLANMQSKLENLNQSMAAVANGQAITHGTIATATIMSVSQDGAMINFQPSCTVELLVALPGRPPIPVTRTEIIPAIFLARAQPGQQVCVRVMPHDLNDIFIDWAAPV